VSVGKQLLFSVLSLDAPEVRSEKLGILVDSGISPAMFAGEDERAAFTFMADYKVQYGSCPSLSLVELETGLRFPQYVSQNPFDFWFDEFRRYLQSTGLIELITRVEGRLSEGRLEDALELVGNEYHRLRDILSARKTTLTLGEMADGILETHRQVQTGAVRTGIFTGFPYIDSVTAGVQPGDFWVLAGESGTGKTYILCRCILSAVMGGKKCLFISMEMPVVQLGRRMLSMGAGVDATNFRVGRLSYFAVNQVVDFLGGWSQNFDDRLILVEGGVSYTVQRTLEKIREIKPDAVFIDGAYMLKSSSYDRGGSQRWAVHVEVVEMLKQIAIEDNIGIVTTFQFDQKQKNKSVSTIMGGQAVGQIASVVIGIENEEDHSGFDPISYKELTLYKGREGEKGKIRLKYDMNRTIIEEDSIIDGTGYYMRDELI
jgi:replicative DNA helicase